MEFMDPAAFGGLFAASFLAATVLPSSSEIVLVGLLATGKFSAWHLLAVASIGNILGAILNYYIGRGVEHYRDRKWFPVTEAGMARAQRWYDKWGRWSLLFSWVPMGGDALTVIAGVMRERLPAFILLVGVAKTARYIAVILFFLFVKDHVNG